MQSYGRLRLRRLDQAPSRLLIESLLRRQRRERSFLRHLVFARLNPLKINVELPRMLASLFELPNVMRLHFPSIVLLLP